MTDDDQPRSMRSGPPPPPVRRKPAPPPPPQRSVSPAPVSTAARVSRQPPPPKRSQAPLAPVALAASAAPSAGNIAPARRSSFPPPLPPPPPISGARSRSMPPPLPQAALTPVAPLLAPVTLEPWAPPGAVERTPVVVVQGVTQTPVVNYTPLSVRLPLAERATLVDNAPITPQTPIVEHAPIVARTPIVEHAPIVAQAPIVEHAPIVAQAPIVADAPIVAQAPIVEHAPIVEPDPPALADARLAEPSVVEEGQIVSHPPVIAGAATVESFDEPGAHVESPADSEPTAVIQPPPAFEPTAHREPTAVVQPPPVAELTQDNEQTTVYEKEAVFAPAEPEPSEQAAAFAQWPSISHLSLVEPAPPRATAGEPSFASSGSEMPVVLETPVPHVRERAPLGLEQYWQRRSEWLPRAHRWSQKTSRNAPRVLVVTAPFIALLGIWAAHSLVVHHRHTAAALNRTAAAVANQPSQSAASTSRSAAAAPASAPPAALTNIAAIADKPSTATPATALADPAEFVRALTRGLPALEALSSEFPGDAQVAVALAGQQAQAQRFDAAVSSVQHALEIDPSSAQNGKVMGILWRAAQSPASEQSFLCLRKLGARGSDIAFDLATTPGVRDSVRERARTELSNFLAFDASADTRVASALLLAPDCTTRKGLLDRAGYEGGKRTASMLERFSRGGGCASGSDTACNACMMGSPVLAHALSKLSAGAKP